MKALSSVWTKAEAVDLLSHEAPSVRGYAAYEIVRQFPASAPLSRPIFSDESLVRWAGIDYGETSPLSAVFARDLCELASPAADSELLWALRNAPATLRREEVFACARKRRPVESASAAFGVLQEREDVEAIRTLGFDPLPSYAPVAQRFAQSSSFQARLAATITLAVFNEDASVRALQPLLADPDPQLRAAANVSAWRLGRAPVAAVEELLRSTDGSERAAAEALIWFPTEKTLLVVERYLTAHPNDEVAMRALVSQRPSPLFLGKMRDWSGRIWRSSAQYDDVLRYLVESRDSGAASIFDGALRAQRWTTIVLGAQGLAAIGSASAPHIRSLERALGDNNAFVVVGAADALLTLKSRGSVSRLREVQAKVSKGSWAERRLGEVISELESLP